MKLVGEIPLVSTSIDKSSIYDILDLSYFEVQMMIKTIFTFAIVNALGMAMMIYFDKKKKRPLATPAMYTAVYVVATILDVLIVRFLL